jgi:hypothetical protein
MTPGFVVLAESRVEICSPLPVDDSLPSIDDEYFGRR